MDVESVGKTILVMEDDLLVRQALVKILGRLHYIVLEAPDGQIGMQVLRSCSTDLVLIDLMMPIMNGYQTIPLMKQEFPELPIIVCSGVDVVKEVIQAIQLGAWDYILKPITDLAILQHSLNRCFERADLLRENRLHREHLEQEIDKRTAELRLRTEELEREVENRKQAESEVLLLNRELEARVEERTQ